MKVALITPFPPSRDGIAEYSRKFVEELNSHDEVEITSIVSKIGEGCSQDNQKPLMSLSPVNWFRIYKILKKADIIHVQFDISNYLLQIPLLFICLLALKLSTKSKLVATYHEAYRDRELYGFLSVIFYMVFNLLFDRIYVHTSLSRDRLIHTYHAKRSKVRCIAHGTNSFTSKKRNHTEMREKYGIPNDAKIILNFGYIYRTKGIEYLIEALNLLETGKTKPYLIIAGEVPKRTGVFRYFSKRNETYLDHLKSQVRTHNLEKFVKFIGYVPYEEVYSLFTLADVVVLPYTHIDQSGVLNYAIAAHTPVIASDIGGLRETLESTGILVEPRNTRHLAREISKYFSGSKSTELRRKYAALANSVSTKSVVNKVAADYLELLENRPTVIHVSAHYPPYLGGTENVAESISQMFAKRNYDVRVITSNIGYKKSYEDLKIDNYQVARLNAIEIANLPIIFSLFPHLLATPRRSIIHVHVVQAFIPEIALVAARLRGSKFIAHFHLDVSPSGRFGFIFALYKRSIFPWMLRSADRVVVFSREQAQLVEKEYGVNPTNIAIIPNGIRAEFFSNRDHTLHKKPRLLFVGRLSPQKNVDLLLHSLSHISDKFETTLVGEGPLIQSLKTTTKQLKLSNVVFAGRKDGDQLLEYYRQSDIFVLPSEHEGMPLVLLEAMAMALPIVATDVVGTRDIVENGENGYLVPLGDTGRFGEILKGFCTDHSKYTKLSRASRQMANKYSWENVTEIFARLYEEIWDA